MPVAVAGGLTGFSMHLLQEELVPVRERCTSACDAEINALDATTIGRYSASAHMAGNVLVASSVALGPLSAVFGAWTSEHPDAWQHALEDTVLVGEVLGVSVLVHQVTAFASRRPRSYLFGAAPDELKRDADAYLSFYSGHTANAFAVASASSYLFTRRHPESPWIVPMWTFTHSLAVLQGTTRVMAGYHYWSDVLIGALVGSTVGVTIPALYEHTDTLTLSAIPTRGGATVSLRWQAP